MPNRYTGTENDPFQEAQRTYLGKNWDRFLGAISGSKVRMSAPGGQIGASPSLGAMGTLDRIGDDDVQRSIAINSYLGNLQDSRRVNEQSLREMTNQNDAADAQARDRQTVERAVAIANSPNVSAQGRPILGGAHNYLTAPPDPNAPPVDRQQIAAQMAPGLLDAPPPPKPVTYGNPEPAMVNGKSVFVRAGSDGLTYDMARRPIAPESIAPIEKPKPGAANPEEEKMLEDAANNILGNPRDLTSIRTITSLRGDERLRLYNKIKEKDPKFNVGNIDRQIKFLDSYENPTGRAATNRGSMNNILQHASDLSDANQQYRRTNMRIVNTPIAVLQRQGGTEWQQFATPLAVLKDEIGLYFAGGYAPSGEQEKTWNSVINDTATPAQVEQFAKDIIHVGLRRADTHNEQFKTVMGYDDPNLITPQAVQAGIHLGLGDTVKKYGSGGQIGDAPGTGGPKSGVSGSIIVKDPNGVEHPFETQAQADAFKKLWPK